MVSVTTSALPALIASNRSASGTRQTRWSHGLYEAEVGVDLLLRQVLGELAQQSSTDSVGVAPGLAIHVLAEAPILLAGEFERQAIGQHLRRASRRIL